MGEILNFKSAARPAIEKHLRADFAGAEIHFFPGVRYERAAEAPARPLKTRATREDPTRPSGGSGVRRKKQPA